MKSLSLCFLIFCTSISTFAQSYLASYTGHTREGKAIRVRAAGSSIRFIFYKPDILRVDFFPSDTTSLDPSLVVVQDTVENVAVSIAVTDSLLRISSNGLTIIVNKNPVRLSYYDAGGQSILAEPTEGGLATLQAQRWATFTMTDDDYYGTGERGTSLDKRFQTFESYNTQVYGYGSPLGTMNLNVPFVASPKGYALYFDNTYKGVFDFGATNPNKFVYKATGGELSYYLIAAPQVQGQLDKYTWLTGRQPLPPKWAFGFIQSKFGYRNETEARAMVQTMRSKQIPCDAIVLDLYWFNSMGDLSWNPTAFPNPAQMMSDFLSLGIKTIVITEPYVASSSSNYSAGSSLGYFAKNAGGQTYGLSNWWSCNCTAALLDVTKPEAQQWWWSKHPPFFGSQLAGIWTDLGEPERHPADMYHALGKTDKVHNIYNLLWAKTIFEGFNQFRPNQRLFNLTRSGFAGSQRYASIPWSGDVARSFNGLAVQLPIMLGMGMSGFAYPNSDIGGFTGGTTSSELYVRWMQFGTFSPIARAHGAGQDTEPWAFGPQAEAIAKKYIELRYRLVPYIYTMAQKNFESGLPIARPLFFESPNDENLKDESSSYLFGDNILVSPVVSAGQATKTLYLPAGKWLDYWTDDIHEGGRTITVNAPLETLPLFVKAGSIIPMQSAMNFIGERPVDTLWLSMYPYYGSVSDFQLYEDDGVTLAYQSGSFARRYINVIATNSQLAILFDQSFGSYAGQVRRRVFISEVHGVVSSPTGVAKNGQLIPQRSSYDDLRQNGDGYFYDATLRRLFVHTPTVLDSAYFIRVDNLRLTDVGESASNVPVVTKLEQNFPNPFNPQTTIAFSVDRRSHVTLKVFDILGRDVATLLESEQAAGRHEVQWDGRNLPSGVYFYQIRSGSFVETKKLILMR